MNIILALAFSLLVRGAILVCAIALPGLALQALKPYYTAIDIVLFSMAVFSIYAGIVEVQRVKESTSDVKLKAFVDAAKLPWLLPIRLLKMYAILVMRIVF